MKAGQGDQGKGRSREGKERGGMSGISDGCVAGVAPTAV